MEGTVLRSTPNVHDTATITKAASISFLIVIKYMICENFDQIYINY